MTAGIIIIKGGGEKCYLMLFFSFFFPEGGGVDKPLINHDRGAEAGVICKGAVVVG